MRFPLEAARCRCIGSLRILVGFLRSFPLTGSPKAVGSIPAHLLPSTINLEVFIGCDFDFVDGFVDRLASHTLLEFWWCVSPQVLSVRRFDSFG